MNLLKEFEHNVFCRRESNQEKAYKLWEKIKIHLNEEDRNCFFTEWSHYRMTGYIEIFSFFYKVYVKKYFIKDKINPKRDIKIKRNKM